MIYPNKRHDGRARYIFARFEQRFFTIYPNLAPQYICTGRQPAVFCRAAGREHAAFAIPDVYQHVGIGFCGILAMLGKQQARGDRQGAAGLGDFGGIFPAAFPAAGVCRVVVVAFSSGVQRFVVGRSGLLA